MSGQIQEFPLKYNEICYNLSQKDGKFVSSNLFPAGTIYDDHDKMSWCTDKSLVFEIPDDVNEKVYLYYQLDNFYQNHRRYVKSRSNTQLDGKLLKAEEIKTDCDPIYKMSNLWYN
jgi:hypothetical protein